jgi:hypothetical protein
LTTILSKTGAEQASAAVELSLLLQHDTRGVVEVALSEGLFVELTAALERLPSLQWGAAWVRPGT